MCVYPFIYTSSLSPSRPSSLSPSFSFSTLYCLSSTCHFDTTSTDCLFLYSIPKSVTPSRIESNLALVDLSQEDIDAITAIGDESKGGKQSRWNVPIGYKPKWDIDVFGSDAEKGAKNKIKVQ
jgi:hypothetical protein